MQMKRVAAPTAGTTQMLHSQLSEALYLLVAGGCGAGGCPTWPGSAGEADSPA
jgi:hypothetical protein